jgi:hypothetical protein
MALLRRIPIYATGLGLTVALVAVADSRDWSGLRTLLVAFAVAAFYVVTILVPWLIREQLARPSDHRTNGAQNGEPKAVEILLEANGVLVPRNGQEWSAVTRGPVLIEHSEPHVTAL